MNRIGESPRSYAFYLRVERSGRKSTACRHLEGWVEKSVLMLNRRAALAALSAAVVASAGARASAAANLTTLNVGSSAEDDLGPVLYGITTGAFAKTGLDVQVTLLGSGSAAASAVAGGSLQIAKSSSLPLVTAHARGVPFTIIASGTISTSEHPSSVIVVRPDSPLRSPRDFNGKTFGQNSLGDVGVLLSRAWLDANGGDSRTLKFLEMPGISVGPALAEGRIDAATLRNPGLAAVLGSGEGKAFAHPGDALGKRIVISAWFSTIEYVEANRDTVRRFASVMHDASAYSNANPHQMAKYLAPYFHQDIASLSRTEPALLGSTLDVAEIQPIVDAALRYGLIANGFPAAELLARR
jgi:NitT/TauT family transport system substrate-binding protein